MTASPALDVGAILLAGGRASRMSGAVKPLLDVGGRSLLRRAVDAAESVGASPIIAVGPVLDAALDVTWVREDPPFSGPAAAIVAAVRSRAGAEANDPVWTLVLACDLPSADAAVRRLVEAIMLLPSDTEGVCLADSSARPQWLVGIYLTSALRAAASALPDNGRDAPVRALLDDLAVAVVPADDAVTHDIDTWDDLTVARARAGAAPNDTKDVT